MFQFEVKKADLPQPLLPAGEAEFEVLDAAPHTSKAGKESLRLEIQCVRDGVTAVINEYISPNSLFKLEQLCAASGLDITTLMDTEGRIDESELIARTGVCQLEVDDRDPKFDPRNRVQFFGKPKSKLDRAMDAQSKMFAKAAPAKGPGIVRLGASVQHAPPQDGPDPLDDLDGIPF